mgnify:CR=1 FL=1
MTFMKTWNLTTSDPGAYVLAADARSSSTDYVNDQIWRNTKLSTTIMNLDEALESGAVAIFGEKYQEEVRVVEVPGGQEIELGASGEAVVLEGEGARPGVHIAGLQAAPEDGHSLDVVAVSLEDLPVENVVAEPVVESGRHEIIVGFDDGQGLLEHQGVVPAEAGDKFVQCHR